MSNRQIGTIVLVIAMIIVAISVLFTNNLARALQAEEQKNMAVWANATQQLIVADDEANIDFYLSIIEKNTTIPVYISDEAGNVLSSRNVPEGKHTLGKHGPIELKIDESTTQYITWDDSSLLTRLRYVPYAQFALIFIFIAVAVITMLTGQRSEENRLWVGLSKETAHQLGTPISSLMAWTEILRENYPDDELIPEMDKDVKRLQLIADRFSKIGSAPEIQNVELGELLEHVVEYMNRRTSQKVEITYSTPEIKVQVNPQLFEWVFENLCKNAVDAMEGKGSIHISAHADEHLTIIDVADTGKGITSPNLQDVFNPGYTTKKRGWGLGLSLAKRIVEEYHNGKIYVLNSEKGKGTTFRIELRFSRKTKKNRRHL